MEHSEWQTMFDDNGDDWFRQMDNEAERYLLELQERAKTAKATTTTTPEQANETTSDRRI